MHAEVLGNRVLPTSGNIIDTNRTPILLLKASKAGIPVSPFVVTDSVKQIIKEIGFPTVIFAVNPFSYDGYRIAKNRSGLYRALKSLGMNYKFAVCAEPLKSEITSFKSVFGKTTLGGRLAKIAERVYDAFGIPICKLHVQLVNGEAFLCSLQPLKADEILASDIDVMNEEISEMSESERLVG